MIIFLLWHWLLWIQSNFQVTKKQQQQKQKQKKGLIQGENVRTSCISFSLSQNSHRTTQTNAVNKQKSPPWVCNKWCSEACAQNVFQPWRPTLTSRSLQSFARQFQKRFRQVFGNARILLFYLSLKAWEKNFSQISFRMVLFSVWWR